MHFVGNSSSIPMDHKRAHELFLVRANNGDGCGHWGLALQHATGLGAPASQARAIVHLTFAAIAGVAEAAMGLAFRHSSGLAMPADCEAALMHYRSVADQVAAGASLADPVLLFSCPGPFSFSSSQLSSSRLEEQHRGAAAMAERRRVSDASGGSTEDLLSYYTLNAERGDAHAQLTMGQVGVACILTGCLLLISLPLSIDASL
jgi:TPR repeat protein